MAWNFTGPIQEALLSVGAVDEDPNPLVVRNKISGIFMLATQAAFVLAFQPVNVTGMGANTREFSALEDVPGPRTRDELFQQAIDETTEVYAEAFRILAK